MNAFQEILAEAERSVQAYREGQIREPGSIHHGGVLTPELLPEPKAAAFAAANAIAVYLNPRSALRGDPELAERIRLTLDYLERIRRPNGCYDYLPCNFGSAPDTCFMMLRLVLSWKLLDRYAGPGDAWLRDRLLPLLERSADGVAAGGFHTPNHRWAIAAYLVSCARITGREELSARARQYLAEGIDCNADGEYSERSTGDYNVVNNEQMIRLFLETGERAYLDHAARNLSMMMSYFDPDGSVFTGNSTRQDHGRKVFPAGYVIQYLLVGYLTGNHELGAAAYWVHEQCRRRGLTPDCLDWLMLFPEAEGFAAGDPAPARLFDYDARFPASGVVRMRHGRRSVTLLARTDAFLFFQCGEVTLRLRIGAHLCEHRAFVPREIEPVEGGYRMRCTLHGWYYLPFAEKPATADWWAMDNGRREKILGPDLEVRVDVTPRADGVDLALSTRGLDRLPLRVEICVAPEGCAVETEAVLGASVEDALFVREGMVGITHGGDRVQIGPAFAEHAFVGGTAAGARLGAAFAGGAAAGARPRAAVGTGAPHPGGAPRTLYFTTFTPVERTIRIRSAS